VSATSPQRTQYYCAASLDGFIADPDDNLDWLIGYEGSSEGGHGEPDPMAAGGSYESFYAGAGALVSGSTTYEWLLDHIGAGGSWLYSGKPYRVLSTRELPIPEGEGVDVRISQGKVGDLHAELLDAADGRNLWILGGGGVASQFADAGLLDDLLLTVVPVVLGAGKPVFARPPGDVPLRLTGTTAYRSGMVELRYELPR
jgi:dihydrofolate reductase